MTTLPRFRLPDESSSQEVSQVVTTARLQALDFDDLDRMETRVLDREGRHTLRQPQKIQGGRPANVDDVMEELRAAAAGRSSKVRELTSDDLLDEVPDADDVQEVDISELVFDRVVARRDVWNVHKAALQPPRASILGPLPVRTRFIVTAALAMVVGAVLAVIVAVAIWRFSGLSI